MTLNDKRHAVRERLEEENDRRLTMDWVGQLDIETLINGFVTNADDFLIAWAYDELCGEPPSPEERHTNQIFAPNDNTHLEGQWD